MDMAQSGYGNGSNYSRYIARPLFPLPWPIASKNEKLHPTVCGPFGWQVHEDDIPAEEKQGLDGSKGEGAVGDSGRDANSVSWWKNLFKRREKTAQECENAFLNDRQAIDNLFGRGLGVERLVLRVSPREKPELKDFSRWMWR